MDLEFQNYSRPFEAEFNTRVTAKNKKYGFEKISDLEIIRSPVVTHIVAGHLESAAIIIDYPDEPVKLYRIDLNPWNGYTGPFNVYENSTVFAVVENESGFRSNVAFTTVDGIFISPPTFSDQSSSNAIFTVYTVIIDYPPTSAIKHYRIDNDSWADYTGPLTLYRNCVVFARRSNEHDKWSEIVSYPITSLIVTTPIITAELSPDKSYVTISIEFGNSSIKEYSFDQLEWFGYTGPINFYNNGIVIFARGTTDTGIETDISQKQIAGIIIDTPIISMILSSDRSMVTASVNFGNTVSRFYSLDQINWIEYTQPLYFYNNNVALYAKGISRGNEESLTATASTSGIVIDTPVINYTISSDESSANIIINYGNLIVRLYSFDNINWSNYSIPFDINENKTIYAKGIARNNMESATVSVNITGIFGDSIIISDLLNPGERINSMCFGQNKFVYLISETSATLGQINIATSTNGFTLTRRTLTITQTSSSSAYSLQFLNNMFFMMGYNFLATSPDAVTWTKRTLPNAATSSRTWTKIAYNGSNKYIMIAFANGTDYLLTSTNATTWTQMNSPVAWTLGTGHCQWIDILYANSIFYLVDGGISATNNLLQSKDAGVTWTGIGGINRTESVRANNLYHIDLYSNAPSFYYRKVENIGTAYDNWAFTFYNQSQISRIEILRPYIYSRANDFFGICKGYSTNNVFLFYINSALESNFEAIDLEGGSFAQHPGHRTDLIGAYGNGFVYVVLVKYRTSGWYDVVKRFRVN